MSDEMQVTAINIEKRLCVALLRQWRPSGMSVESLAFDAAKEIERLRSEIERLSGLAHRKIAAQFEWQCSHCGAWVPCRHPQHHHWRGGPNYTGDITTTSRKSTDPVRGVL